MKISPSRILNRKLILGFFIVSFVALLQGCPEKAGKRDLETEKRARELCEKLRNETFGFPVHEWSYLSTGTVKDGELADELVSLGERSLRYLEPLLKDKTKVVIAGSEYATLAEAYRLRVCDFAFRYWCRIRHIEYRFHETPAKRDQEMDDVLFGLSKKTG